jgi:hypothetical protein
MIEMGYTALVQLMARAQKMAGRPSFLRVASKNGTTEYRFPKFRVCVKTLSMMSVEATPARRPGMQINVRGER